MAPARHLSAAFLASSTGRTAGTSAASALPTSAAHTSPALDADLAAVIEAARGAWAGSDAVLGAVTDEGFATFLGARVEPEQLGDLASGTTGRAGDLWAACAAGRGDGRVLGAVEARYFPDLDAALGKMGLSHDRAGEVKQGLRRTLFVGDPPAGVAPRIGEYRGTGDLRAWLRVSAMRAALKLLRKTGRETSNDDAILEARAETDDPELSYMKAAYRAAFKVAFQEALDSLEPRERTFLKQQIVDGLGIDELGALYEVHRATAARWIQGAREKLLTRTRRAFMHNARISSEECESIMRLVRSQLDVSLHRRLGAG